MKVRFLYFKGCPHAEPALNLLKEVLKEKGIKEEIEIIEINSKEDAEKYHFLGSPTIQINGLDIEKERRNDLPAMGCRVYKTKDGYSGVPPKEMIEKAIEEAIASQKKKRVLFICTHNSARSQMAEGLLKALYGDRYEVYSAGTYPTVVNPYAIKVMSEIGIDISEYKSKSIEDFIGMNIDYVVTVCDRAKETCPYFPGAKKYLHQSFEDPASYEGDEEEKLNKFRKVRDEIKEWIIKTFG